MRRLYCGRTREELDGDLPEGHLLGQVDHYDPSQEIITIQGTQSMVGAPAPAGLSAGDVVEFDISPERGVDEVRIYRIVQKDRLMDREASMVEVCADDDAGGPVGPETFRVLLSDDGSAQVRDFEGWDDDDIVEQVLEDGGSCEEAAELGHMDLVDLGPLGRVLVSGDRMCECDDSGYVFFQSVSDYLWGLSDFALDQYAEDHGLVKNEWDDVSVAYHATQPDNIDAILENGLEVRNDSRGISNRSTPSAIFLSEDIDEMGSYGSALFEVDLASMKADGYTPRLEREDPVAIGNIRVVVADRLGVDDPYNYTGDSPWEGIDENTLVLFDNIPSKYIKLIG